MIYLIRRLIRATTAPRLNFCHNTLERHPARCYVRKYMQAHSQSITLLSEHHSLRWPLHRLHFKCSNEVACSWIYYSLPGSYFVIPSMHEATHPQQPNPFCFPFAHLQVTLAFFNNNTKKRPIDDFGRQTSVTEPQPCTPHWSLRSVLHHFPWFYMWLTS